MYWHYKLGALIHQSVKVKDKDIRQFLDGIYVSDKRLALNENWFINSTYFYLPYKWKLIFKIYYSLFAYLKGLFFINFLHLLFVDLLLHILLSFTSEHLHMTGTVQIRPDSAVRPESPSPPLLSLVHLNVRQHEFWNVETLHVRIRLQVLKQTLDDLNWLLRPSS